MQFLSILRRPTFMFQNRVSLRGRYWIWCRMILFFATAGSVSTVHAQEPSDSIVQRRISFLQKSLLEDQQGTKLWWYGWLTGYGAAAAVQGAICFSSTDKTTRQDMAVGAITNLAGLTGQFISTFQPISFARKALLLPERTSGEKLEKMTQLEKMLADRSLMETEARHWKAHILCTGVNLTSGLVTWLGFHRTMWEGVVNFGMNCVITEAQIWSQPIRARRALQRYEKCFEKKESATESRPKIDLNFVVSSNGPGVRLNF